MDRQALTQALAKIIAFHHTNKPVLANEWAARLLLLLADEGITPREK